MTGGCQLFKASQVKVMYGKVKNGLAEEEGYITVMTAVIISEHNF